MRRKGRTIRKVMGGTKQFIQAKMSEKNIHARKNAKKKMHALDEPHFDIKPEL